MKKKVKNTKEDSNGDRKGNYCEEWNTLHTYTNMETYPSRGL